MPILTLTVLSIAIVYLFYRVVISWGLGYEITRFDIIKAILYKNDDGIGDILDNKNFIENTLTDNDDCDDND